MSRHFFLSERWRSLAIASLLMASACSTIQPERANAQTNNWDRTWWGMSREEFLSRYPEATLVQGEAWLPATRLESNVAFRDLIAPGSRIRFWFDYGETGYALARISFITPKSYDDTVLSLRGEFGPQISGDDTEASCFDSDGARRVFDPSGVGHVLALCMGAARFVDRAQRNCVDVGGAGASRPYLETPAEEAFQFVELSNVDACA